MLRLPTWRWPSKRRSVGVYCIFVSPHDTETRWLDKLPTPGTRIRSRGGHGFWGMTWVVDEVLQSGRDTYTVFCVSRSTYLDKLRNGPGFQPDLSAELLEAARRAREALSEQRRRRRYRDYYP